MADGRGHVIRRKVGAVRADPTARPGEGGSGPDKSWRIALARAARDHLRLGLDVTRLSLDQLGLPEILELAPARSLIAILEGPMQALGVMLLGPDVLTGMIEAQTTGLVSAVPSPDRRPTRTDAVMVAGMIDAALEGLASGLEGVCDADWALGFRYASFLDDTRPLGLLLEDVPYKVIRSEVSLAQGKKSGPIFLAFPDQPRSLTTGAAPDTRGNAEAAQFTESLAQLVMSSAGELGGVLARLTMPIAHVMDLEAGQILPLGNASLDRITLESMDGCKLWDGRLGQSRGVRAIRLMGESGDAAKLPTSTRLAPAVIPLGAVVPPPLRATGTG